LATIRHEWEKTAETAMDRARVTALTSAEEELTHGGSLKVLELSAKVGLFALLEIAESKITFDDESDGRQTTRSAAKRVRESPGSVCP
jgi:hypothetical protein